jgi:hypothetical protein
MNDSDSWDTIKESYPLGVETDVTIKKKVPFGMFVELRGYPQASALIDALSFRPGDRDVWDHSEWPEVGSTVRAIVAEHVDRNRQVRLRVGSELFDDQTGA